jgi:3-hydroxyisobutyrate dehydrogenase-like beta-hydroxyacid dehydrogenase
VTGPAVGFIGFGEAGYAIAKGLQKKGINRLFAYDVDVDRWSPDRGDQIRRHAEEAGVALADSLQELAGQSEMVFSTVVASSALSVAEKIAPHLTERHIYLDLNSTSPSVQQRIEKIVAASGAAFVEAAVMAAVPQHGHQVPMLLGGKAAPRAVEVLAPYGMRFEVLGDKVGSASAVKMFRSAIIKGLEALILECLLAASRYGVEERVFHSLDETFARRGWNDLAHYLMCRTAIHGKRRAHEMEEVARTIEALNIEPVMAAAAARRLLWGAELGIKDHFEKHGPETYHDVLHAIHTELDK